MINFIITFKIYTRNQTSRLYHLFTNLLENENHNSMDPPRSVAEIETTIKLLKPRQITLRTYEKSEYPMQQFESR